MRPYTDIEQSRLGTMTQAEKAKRFDEALKLAKEQHQYPWVRGSKDVLEEIFPELRESDDEKIRKWLIGTIKQIPDDSIEWKTICKSDVLAWLDRPSELKHKFNIGDIISNGQVVYRVCNITKNCIGQDCYFLVNVESEKDGTRYRKLTDSEGKQHNLGEITWLCEQVDKSFEKQGEQKPADNVEPTDYNSIDPHFGKPIDKVEPKSHEGDSIYKVASTDDGYHYEWNDDKHELKKIEDEPTPITEDYNPYEAAVKSIAKMCKRYDRMDLDSLQDFYDNVKVKCKDAVDYDSLYLQNAKD